MRRDRIRPQMPPNVAPHLIDRLIEIGLTGVGGLGAVPLSWGEIDAWCNRTHVDLEPWEARLIRKLSMAYLTEARLAEDEHRPPPWAGVVTAREREVETDRLRELLG